MCDYFLATNNVIEAALDSSPGPDTKSYSNNKKLKCCKIFLTLTTFIITTADVVADWYNYINLTSPKQKQSHITALNGHLLVHILFASCICATVLYALEVLSVLLQFVLVFRKEKKSGKADLFEETLSGLLLVCQDFPVVSVYLVAFLKGVCPLVDQIQSTPGRISLVTSGISIAWRMIQSLSFCCRCKKVDGRKCCCVLVSVFVRLFRSLLLTLSALLLLATITLSFSINVNNVPGLDSFAQLFAQTERPNGPVYIFQKVNVDYVIKRQYDRKRQAVFAPAATFDEWLQRKRRGLPSFNRHCHHYITRIFISDANTLKQAGHSGIVRTLPCSEATPYFWEMLPPDHQRLFLNRSRLLSCTVTFRFVYNDDQSLIHYGGGYEIREGNGTDVISNCFSGRLGFGLERTYEVKLLKAWSSSTYTAVKNYECQPHPECPGRVSPIYSKDRIPYISCVGDFCELDTISRPWDKNKPKIFGLSGFIFVPHIDSPYYGCDIKAIHSHSLDLGLCSGKQNLIPHNQPDSNTHGLLTCLESPFGEL